ncbi:bifunctional (p)ppGpp synthetase/guanosine-3',5'-bis(diphosphate) 3'-pyrophosphohydrolase [Candidatus Roizmanbacteria bacterium]|nr:bifunctional (p)ppGpp synthetase/guanosine-3',5'-bis(diphosphate) 3'-pyrophosphohydrolase [Candidatus Roizmanbacteria bacterium]
MQPELDGRLFPRPLTPAEGDVLSQYYASGYVKEVEGIQDSLIQESWKTLSEKLSYIQEDDPVAFHEIAQSFYFAFLYHDQLSKDPDDRLRKDGTHYMTHPAAVASILADYQLDADTIKAALLHDTLEDTEMTSELMTALFGDTVTRLVEGVSKITGNRTKQENEEQTLKKKYASLLTEEGGDVRIVLIKLADRLHNLRTIDSLIPFRQEATATETIRHYVSLAMRLGLTDMQNELEERSYRILDPVRAEYAGILQERTQNYIDPLREDTEEMYQHAIYRASLDAHAHISYPTFGEYYRYLYEDEAARTSRGKPATYYINIVYRAGIDVSDESMERLIGALQPITSMYRGVFQFNHESGSYEILGPDYKVCLYTEDAYKVQTYSIHESYQQGVRDDSWLDSEQYRIHRNKLDPLRRTVRQLISQNKIDELAEDLSGELMYVFTPKRELVTLPIDATVADYAALIPGEFLITASQAKVNGKQVPLDYVLSQRDIIEIKTAKQWNPSVVNFETVENVRRTGTKARIYDALANIIRVREDLPENDMAWARHEKFQERLRWFGYSSTKDGAEKLRNLIVTRFKEAKQRGADLFISRYNDEKLDASGWHNPYIHPEQAWELVSDEIKRQYTSLEFFYAYAACQRVPSDHIQAFIDAVVEYENRYLETWSAIFSDEPGIMKALTERIGSFNIAALQVVNTFNTGNDIRVDLMLDKRGFTPEQRDALLFNLYAYVQAKNGTLITYFSTPYLPADNEH